MGRVGTIAFINVTLTFTKAGELSAGSNVTLALIVPIALTIDHVRCYCKTAPAGSDIIVDINKAGTTIFTTQGNRPTIPDGNNLGAKSVTPDVTSLAEGDILTLDIDQIGSGTAGEDLTVEARCKKFT